MEKVMVFCCMMFLVLPAYVLGEDSGEYIHYSLAVRYKNEKLYDQAIDEFRKVLAAYPDHYNSYMHLAEIRSLQGKPKLVIYNLEKALSYNPGWGKAQKMLASAYETDGQKEMAVQVLQKYLTSCDPSEKDSVQSVIDKLLMKKGETAKLGEVKAEPEVASFTVNPDTTVKDTAVKNEKQKETPVIAAKPKSPLEEAYSKVIDLYEKKKFDQALLGIKEVLTLEPGHTGAYYYAGLIREQNGQKKMAKINYVKSANDPLHGASAQFHLGKLLGEEGNRSEAVKYLKASLADKNLGEEAKEASALLSKYSGTTVVNNASQKPAPKTPKAAPEKKEPEAEVVSSEKYAPIEIQIDALLSMMTVDTLTDAGQKLLGGIRSFTDGNFDDAVREFRKVIAANPNGTIAANCIYNTGVCYYKLRLFKDAEHQFQSFLDRFPAHPFAAKSLFLKALCYQQRGDYKVSERLLREFIQNHRKHEWVPKAYERLGDSYADLEDQKKAADAYAQALSGNCTFPDQVAINFKLANTYSKLGNYSRAITCYTKAIECGEKNDIYLRVPDSYYKIADLKFQQKDYSSAMDYYKRVTRKYPAFQETPWGLFQIANILRNDKHYREAINLYKDLITQYPDDYWAKQAQWKMEDAIWEHEYRSAKN